MNNLQPKISVIIPVYNSEKYIRKCLDSVILQTYEVYEILCINDGSTDNSLKILQEYAQKDSRIKIFNQENKGPAAARNCGLQNATGDYISFVDADDWISLTLYKTFAQLVENKNVDIFIFNADVYNETCEDLYPRGFFDINSWNNHTSDETIHNFHDCRNPFSGNYSVCNKIYRKSFLEEKDIKFVENNVFEGQIFDLLAFFNSESILVSENNFYKYRIHNTSLMQNLKNNIFDIFKVIEIVDDCIRVQNLYDEYKYALFQYKYEELTLRFIESRFIVKPQFYQKMKNILLLAKDSTLDFNVCKQLKNFSNYQKIVNSDCFEFYMNRSI